MGIPKASLKFSAYAWAKLQYVLHYGKTEVSMMGVSLKEDPLSIIDLVLLPQEVTSVSVDPSEEGIANFYEDCIDAGMHPQQYSRVWIHTHPSGIHSPSATDERTFESVYGNCDWAIMYIIAKDNYDYCALQYNKFPKNRIELTGSRIDFSIPFNGSDKEKWEKEYKENVKEKVIIPAKVVGNSKILNHKNNFGMKRFGVNGVFNDSPLTQDPLEEDEFFDCFEEDYDYMDDDFFKTLYSSVSNKRTSNKKRKEK